MFGEYMYVAVSNGSEFSTWCYVYIWAMSWENLSYAICKQQQGTDQPVY